MENLVHCALDVKVGDKLKQRFVDFTIDDEVLNMYGDITYTVDSVKNDEFTISATLQGKKFDFKKTLTILDTEIVTAVYLCPNTQLLSEFIKI